MSKATNDRVRALQSKLSVLSEKLKHVTDMLAEAMSATFENPRLKKQLLVIGHIAAGRSNDAINEILTASELVFSMDVRYADDKGRIASEDALLHKLVQTLKETLDAIKIKRGDTPEATL